MKLDEAIKHEEELVNEYEGYAKKIREKMKSEISLYQMQMILISMQDSTDSLQNG